MIQNKIISVIGHKGYGKTTLTEKLAILTDKPTIICDPRFQYNTVLLRRLHFKSVSSFRKWLSEKNNYMIFKKYKLEIIVNAFTDTFEELATLVNKMNNITFVIDEIDMFFDTRADNKTQMYKMVNYGRHNKIDIITTSRRPARINRDLTSQTDVFYFSRLREPNDKKYIKALYGADEVSQVENLEKFSFLRCEDDKKEIIKTTIKDMQILQA